MARSHDIDMLKGPLAPKIIAYALPVAASGFLQQLFNAADVAVVGRFAGSEALAAVGANTYLISLMVNLFVGVSLGANVTIANYVGEGDERGVSRATHTAVAFSCVCGLALLVGGQLFARQVHHAVGTPDELLDQATLYFRIYYLGMPPIMLYNFASAVLRSKGDTRRPLVVLIISGALNFLLNLVFVIGLKMDVAGVALATLLANVVSSLALIVSTIPALISIVGICGTRVLWVNTGFVMLPTYSQLILAYPISWAVTAVAQAVAYRVVVRKKMATQQVLPAADAE